MTPAEQILAKLDEQKKLAEASQAGACATVNAVRFSRVAPQCVEALREAVKALSDFADYDNLYQPKDVCWPASEYMKKSREALAEIAATLGVGE
jgi:hypothetical protein